MINRLTTALNLNRLTGMISTPSGGGQLPFSYGASYNEANQRITVTMNDGSYWVYEYNTLGQISSAKKHFSDGAFVPGQQFTYSYDHIGNRSTTRAGGDQNGSLSGDGYSYYVDGFLNQYTTRYRPYPVHVTGAADPDETVYVNGAQVAYRNGEYFWKELSYVSTLATWFKIEVATSGGETNVGHVFLPSRPEYFTYDLDGNMVTSGRWNYTWDAENRLTSMTDNTTCTNDVPKRIVFEYDYLGRRIAKKVWNNTAGTNDPIVNLKYLYDGWNLIAELDGNNALVRAYTWGLDAGGSMQGAGGVGGLLMVNAGSGGVHFPAYDLNGNVMGLVNAANGNISAKYEYGPFGEIFCSVGDMAKVNPFGFSNEVSDE
jgi:YD repeat-containing protein